VWNFKRISRVEWECAGVAINYPAHDQPYEGGISINDSILIEDLRAILPQASFDNLQHLVLLKNKIDSLTQSYEAAIVATGTQMFRDEIEEDAIIGVYHFLKQNNYRNRSVLIEKSGYNSNVLAYYARNETKAHPRKGIHCVYLLIKDSEVVYVGRSQNLKLRLKQHRRDKDFDRHEFYRCESIDKAKDLEAVLIQQHRPRLNQRIEKRSGL
jgi:hypothetical protein